MHIRFPSLNIFSILLIVLIIFSGCSPNPQTGAQLQQQAETPIRKTETKLSTLPSSSNDTPLTSENPADIFIGYTYQQPDGNRIIPGKGSIKDHTPLEFKLPGKPIWITGVPYQNNVLWAVVLEDGSTVSYLASDQGVTETTIQPNQLPPGIPPLLISSKDEYSLVTVPFEDQSPLTHPTYLPHTDLRIYITNTGDLKFVDSEDYLTAILNVNALPDGRILIDEDERLLVLSDPTDKYNHGILGDQFEAESLTLIETKPEIRISSVITLPENEVIEGISPIWVDLDGDHEREIVVTVSDLELGAGILVFSEAGERLAEGPKMGRPFRWRHQIGYLNLGPSGENELVVVRTPHIGGVVEYYQYSDGDLYIVAEHPGITSHILGSRNLDMAALGDFDGEGNNEILLPNPDLTELFAVRRTPSGAEEAWRATIGGVMSTNISGVILPNDRIAIAVGREDNVLSLWMP